MKRLKKVLASNEDSNKKLYSIMCSADTLYKQVKFFHWVMNGQNYISLHRFLDEVAEKLSEIVDLTAERLVYLGFNPVFDPQEVIDNSNVKYSDEKSYNGFSSIVIIVEGLSEIIKDLSHVSDQLGEEKDYGTQQFTAEALYDLEVLKHHLLSFKD